MKEEIMRNNRISVAPVEHIGRVSIRLTEESWAPLFNPIGQQSIVPYHTFYEISLSIFFLCDKP